VDVAATERYDRNDGHLSWGGRGQSLSGQLKKDAFGEGKEKASKGACVKYATTRAGRKLAAI